VIEDHKAEIRVFRAVAELPKFISKQIVKAIDPVYIKPLRNRNTNTIQADVPVVLVYLFNGIRHNRAGSFKGTQT